MNSEYVCKVQNTSHFFLMRINITLFILVHHDCSFDLSVVSV